MDYRNIPASGFPTSKQSGTPGPVPHISAHGPPFRGSQGFVANQIAQKVDTPTVEPSSTRNDQPWASAAGLFGYYWPEPTNNIQRGGPSPWAGPAVKKTMYR